MLGVNLNLNELIHIDIIPSPSYFLCLQMPKDLEMLLKTTYFGTIMMLVRIDTDNTDTADTK